MQCTLAAGGAGLTISGVLSVMLLAVTVAAGWHFGRWLIWLATHNVGPR